MNGTGLHDERRSELIHHAVEAAVRRLNDAGADPATGFAATAELIMWLVAADDGLQRHPTGGEVYKTWRAESQDRLQLLRGLRYVRNKVIHESSAWEQSFKDVYTERYYDHYGAWVWSELPPPAQNEPDHRREQYEAYNVRLCGRAVLDTALDALDQLRVWWGAATSQ